MAATVFNVQEHGEASDAEHQPGVRRVPPVQADSHRVRDLGSPSDARHRTNSALQCRLGRRGTVPIDCLILQYQQTWSIIISTLCSNPELLLEPPPSPLRNLHTHTEI